MFNFNVIVFEGSKKIKKEGWGTKRASERFDLESYECARVVSPIDDAAKMLISAVERRRAVLYKYRDRFIVRAASRAISSGIDRIDRTCADCH